jgi:bifunctional non-homologous end joining protein LigD
VRLYSRPGNDLTYRFPLIVEALAGLRSRSCIIDGEAVACDDNGMPSFDRIRYRRHDACVFLYAFDLIELNGDDLRREPLDTRKATLASVLRRAAPGLRLNEHIEADGPIVFAHACEMGLEGIVSKRKDSPYRSGRSPDWLKSKNPACEAARREEEEEWGSDGAVKSRSQIHKRAMQDERSTCNCPVCQSNARYCSTGSGGMRYDCPRCGEFDLTGSLVAQLPSELNHGVHRRALMSHNIRRAQRTENKPPEPRWDLLQHGKPFSNLPTFAR